ncbi:MAG: META domain-containing protein [Cyanobium sp.]
MSHPCRGISGGIAPAAWIAPMALAALMATAHPAEAGTLRGTAVLREPGALPADAEFEVVIEDTARADAPAPVIGRQRIAPAGQPPFRFAIPYRDSDVKPGGTYSLRATVRQRGRLLFTTYTVTRVLDGSNRPVQLQLRSVAGPAGRSPAPLGALPASWQGDIPAAGGATRWHIDLAADGSYQLRQTFLGRPAPNTFDDIGRWQLESPEGRLVLRGGREAPIFLQPVEQGAALRKLDLEGRPIASAHNDRLRRLERPAPIEPRLFLVGLFSYLADAPNIRLCVTPQRLPVAMEGDYRALERAYLKARPAGRPCLPLRVGLQGLIASRPSPEPGQPPRRTLIVEKFVSIDAASTCPEPSGAQATPSRLRVAPLRGTRWRLLALGGQTVATPALPGRAAMLQFATDSDLLSGSGGCNRLMGGFRLAGETLGFSPLASTKMACGPETMALERRFSEALGQVRRWSIDRRSLLLQDAVGRTLLLFQAEDPAPGP